METLGATAHAGPALVCDNLRLPSGHVEKVKLIPEFSCTSTAAMATFRAILLQTFRDIRWAAHLQVKRVC